MLERIELSFVAFSFDRVEIIFTSVTLVQENRSSDLVRLCAFGMYGCDGRCDSSEIWLFDVGFDMCTKLYFPSN